MMGFYLALWTAEWAVGTSHDQKWRDLTPMFKALFKDLYVKLLASAEKTHKAYLYLWYI